MRPIKIIGINIEEMNKDIIKLIVVFLIFVSISWYGKIDHISETTTTYVTEVTISYDEAVRILKAPIYRKNRYFYRLVRVQESRRTLIPFKYKKSKPYKTKKYYVTEN